MRMTTRKLPYLAVIGLLALTYLPSACTGSASETENAVVLTAAEAIAKGANGMAASNGAPNMTTAKNIADSVTESALDSAAFETTEASQIIMTSCATITLRIDEERSVSAHISLESTPDGVVAAVAAKGPCLA